MCINKALNTEIAPKKAFLQESVVVEKSLNKFLQLANVKANLLFQALRSQDQEAGRTRPRIASALGSSVLLL